MQSEASNDDVQHPATEVEASFMSRIMNDLLRSCEDAEISADAVQATLQLYAALIVANGYGIEPDTEERFVENARRAFVAARRDLLQ